jgi:2-iminobutanoate/2-iminopropanoate deaminase
LQPNGEKESIDEKVISDEARSTVANFDVLLSKRVPAPSSAYSQGLALGDLVVTSGYLGTKPDGAGLIAGGFEAELRQALDNITGVLEEAGCAWNDVIRINVSLIDVDKFAEMDRIVREYAREPYPTRNTIGVKELWGGAQVGIDVWAVRPAR